MDIQPKPKDCNFCTSPNLSIYKKNIVLGYDLIKCLDCGVIQANPFKCPPPEFYTKAIDSSSIVRHTKLHEFSQDHPCRSSKILKNGIGKKLLDIGCGNGAFAKIASENGFTVLGIDLDETSLSLAPTRNLKNVDFKLAILDDLLLDENLHHSFDVITMFEVFEHLDNPHETLAGIKKLLKPNGYFIGSLPNVDRPFLMSIHMVYEVPPYHLNYWTMPLWNKFLSKNEFMAIEESNSNYYGYLCDYFKFKSDHLIKNKFMNRLIEIFLGGIKVLLEKPIEKIFAKPAGFFFTFQKK